MVLNAHICGYTILTTHVHTPHMCAWITSVYANVTYYDYIKLHNLMY